MPAFAKKGFLLKKQDGTFFAPTIKVSVQALVEVLSEHGDLLEIQLIQAGPQVVGFAPKNRINTTGVPDDISADIDPIVFAESCLVAARTDGSNAYYLYAVAVIESGVKNIPAGSSASTAFGPFQILESTWLSYINKYQDLGYNEFDRYDPFRQCDVAAKISVEAIEQLTPILPDEPGGSGGRLPSHVELYLAHFLGLEGAKVALQAEMDRETSIRDVLLKIYANNADPAAKADRILKGNAGILQENEQPLTLAAVIDRIADKMNAAFQKAAESFSQLPAGIRLSSPLAAAGQTPWVDVARQEEAMPVLELKGIGQSNPEIEKYFLTTSIGKQPDDTAWCAAFVSWCLVNCGNDKAKQSSIGSARAADWLKWGKKAEKPELGAVAVLHPLTSKSSGHVGFVVDADDTHISLLAGNQGVPGKSTEGVCTKKFPMSKVRAWRVLGP